ncbi:hypothetical protein FNH22_02250 [Fulvivirga sp. M361]|uniref:hypothetical protein n=1 Tax=Fulvivirga sp. M361 TaxID=2594266 RepID=UPI00117B8BC1|nr:hypothetical protein [Fulvivirga sp. M361]TRX62163.1 hypothetical protein FNH22_02250 [Fulvivirga sp. M361]
MDLDRIERLLEKYWECETSLEEEKELRVFFNRPDIPVKWKKISPLFEYYEEELQSNTLGSAFDERVLTRLAPMPAEQKGKVRKLFYDLARVAAVGLIVITATYFIREQYMEHKDDPYMVDTFEDPREAFEETKKALRMISKNFNKGRKEAKKIGVFNNAREKIKNGDNKL